MTIYKRGDIVLVPFPFSDQTAIEQKLVLKKLGTFSAGDLVLLGAALKDLLEL